jgi:hypothetical protein
MGFVIRLAQWTRAVVVFGLASARSKVTQLFTPGLPSVPEPGKPYKIWNNPFRAPTGPNLLSNGSFETGSFPPAPATETIVSGSGVITDWHVLQDGGVARWIDAAHPIFTNAAEGRRFVDLTGGAAPGPARTPGSLYRDTGFTLQAGQSYEVAISVGAGPNNGPSVNFGPPVSISLGILRPFDTVAEDFKTDPATPPQGTGVAWERFAFRFKIPASYSFGSGTPTITIRGTGGSGFIGVDDVSLHLLA